MNNTYNIYISEPWFSFIFIGLKTIEGRLYKNYFCNIKEGDYIEWINTDFNITRTCFTKVVQIKRYDNFKNYLEDNNLINSLPSILTIENGLKIYYNYYKIEDELKYGVVSFKLELKSSLNNI